MPVREFANQKSLIDHAERNGLVYLWERMRAFARRQRMVSPLPALAHAGEADGEAKAIAIMKNGAALLLGGSRPEGDATDQCCRNLSIQMSATTTV